MTDKELKKNLKKLLSVIILIIVIIAGLLMYILNSGKAELSIYANTDGSDNISALGIDEDEFKQYLSIFGELIDSDSSDDIKTLNLSTRFMSEMVSTCQEEAELSSSFDAEIVSKVAQELQGAYVKENLDGGEAYTYDQEKNLYVRNTPTETKSYCTEIESISKNGDQIEVTYKMAMMTPEEKANYDTDENTDFETNSVKAVIINNTDFEYSKYFISSIEKE